MVVQKQTSRLICMTTKLAQRTYDAIKLLQDTTYKRRSAQLALIGERGFALMIYWNQIEIALKLIYYYEHVKDGWPETLKFVCSTWTPIKTLKCIDIENCELVFGRSAESLWKTRNGIAHEGCNVSHEKYNRYREATAWSISELQKQLPSLERLRDRKRRSDAQLKN